MRHPNVVRVAVCMATLGTAAMGPVADASASAKSIRAVIISYDSKVNTAEGHVLTAVGEYEQSKDPAGVQAAIGASVNVIGSLEVKVAHQSAGARRVKKAKSKIVKGLQAIIVGYRELSNAYGEKAASPEAATVEASKALAVVKKGRKQLQDGVKLLS